MFVRKALESNGRAAPPGGAGGPAHTRDDISCKALHFETEKSLALNRWRPTGARRHFLQDSHPFRNPPHPPSKNPIAPKRADAVRLILDIQQVQPALFTYALAAAAAPGRPCGNFFVTVVSVLHDAGRLLSRYFDRVEIRLAGFPLGTFPVAHLVHDPAGVFNALMDRMGSLVTMTELPLSVSSECHARPCGAGRHPDRPDL